MNTVHIPGNNVVDLASTAFQSLSSDSLLIVVCAIALGLVVMHIAAAFRRPRKW